MKNVSFILGIVFFFSYRRILFQTLLIYYHVALLAGFPWLCLAIHPNNSSLPASLLDHILCSYWAVVGIYIFQTCLKENMLPKYIHIYKCVCVCVYTCVSMSVSVCVYVSVYEFLWIWVSACASVCVWMCSCVCPCVLLQLCECVSVSVYLNRREF